MGLEAHLSFFSMKALRNRYLESNNIEKNPPFPDEKFSLPFIEKFPPFPFMSFFPPLS